VRPSRTADAGATLAEFALAVPVLVWLVLGVLEFGLAWRDSSSVANAVRAGARVGSAEGRARLADYDALQSVRAALAEIRGLELERVVVYRSETSDGAVPAACRTIALSPTGTGVAGVCNVYGPADLGRPATDFSGISGSDCSPTAVDRFWCPLGRRTSERTGGPDFLGVWASVRHHAVTSVLPGGLTLTDATVMRLEPEP
jgi:hypothetical protein